VAKEKVKKREGTVEQRVIAVMAEKLLPKVAYTRDTEFTEKGLGTDSVGIMEAILELEDEFDINIPDEDASKVKTIGDVVDLVAKFLENGVKPKTGGPA